MPGKSTTTSPIGSFDGIGLLLSKDLSLSLIRSESLPTPLATQLPGCVNTPPRRVAGACVRTEGLTSTLQVMNALSQCQADSVAGLAGGDGLVEVVAGDLAGEVRDDAVAVFVAQRHPGAELVEVEELVDGVVARAEIDRDSGRGAINGGRRLRPPRGPAREALLRRGGPLRPNRFGPRPPRSGRSRRTPTADADRVVPSRSACEKRRPATVSVRRRSRDGVSLRGGRGGCG